MPRHNPYFFLLLLLLTACGGKGSSGNAPELAAVEEVNADFNNDEGIWILKWDEVEGADKYSISIKYDDEAPVWDETTEAELRLPGRDEEVRLDVVVIAHRQQSTSTSTSKVINLVPPPPQPTDFQLLPPEHGSKPKPDQLYISWQKPAIPSAYDLQISDEPIVVPGGAAKYIIEIPLLGSSGDDASEDLAGISLERKDVSASKQRYLLKLNLDDSAAIKEWRQRKYFFRLRATYKYTGVDLYGKWSDERSWAFAPLPVGALSSSLVTEQEHEESNPLPVLLSWKKPAIAAPAINYKVYVLSQCSEDEVSNTSEESLNKEEAKALKEESDKVLADALQENDRVNIFPDVANPFQHVCEKPLVAGESCDSPLSSTTNYCYWVSALNQQGRESEWSAPIRVKPFPRLDRPRGLVADVGNAKVRLRWARSDDATVAGYRLTVRRDGAPGDANKEGLYDIPQPTVQVEDTDSNVEYYVQKGLENGQRYCFLLQTMDADGRLNLLSEIAADWSCPAVGATFDTDLSDAMTDGYFADATPFSLPPPPQLEGASFEEGSSIDGREIKLQWRFDDAQYAAADSLRRFELLWQPIKDEVSKPSSEEFAELAKTVGPVNGVQEGTITQALAQGGLQLGHHYRLAVRALNALDERSMPSNQLELLLPAAWTWLNPKYGADSWRDIVISPSTAIQDSRILVVGDGGALLTKTSGDRASTWTRGQIPLEKGLYGVAHNNNDIWVAVGAEGQIWRTTGTTDPWQRRSIEEKICPMAPKKHCDLHAVVWWDPSGSAAGRFVAVGQGGLVLRSDDGQNWSDISGDFWPGEERQDLYAIAADSSGGLVATGEQGWFLFALSDDSNQEAVQLRADERDRLQALAWRDDATAAHWISAGRGDKSLDSQRNGSTLFDFYLPTIQTAARTARHTVLINEGIQALLWFGQPSQESFWMATDGGRILHSDDGNDWTEENTREGELLSSLSAEPWHALAGIDGMPERLLAAGDGGRLLCRGCDNDATLWTSLNRGAEDKATGIELQKFRIHSSSGHYLVAGEHGTLMRSTDDGDNWDRFAMPEPNADNADTCRKDQDIVGLEEQGGIMLALGKKGCRWRAVNADITASDISADDNSSWTISSGFFAQDIYAATAAGSDFGSAVFVVGAEGGVWQSPENLLNDASPWSDLSFEQSDKALRVVQLSSASIDESEGHFLFVAGDAGGLWWRSLPASDENPWQDWSLGADQRREGALTRPAILALGIDEVKGTLVASSDDGLIFYRDLKEEAKWQQIDSGQKGALYSLFSTGSQDSWFLTGEDCRIVAFRLPVNQGDPAQVERAQGNCNQPIKDLRYNSAANSNTLFMVGGNGLIMKQPGASPLSFFE